MTNKLNSSLPSQPITIADVPEVKNFAATFVYKHFLPDESINDNNVNVDLIDTDVINKFEKFAPRFVSFQFKPVHLSSRVPSKNEFMDANAISADLLSTDIAANRDAIRLEHEFNNVDFAGLRFQDTGLDQKMFLMASGSVARRVKNANLKIESSFRATEAYINNILSRGNVNLLDVAKLIAAGRGGAEARLIVQSLNQLEKLNARFIDAKTQKLKTDEKFKRVKDVGLDVQINAKFASTMLNSVVTDVLGLYADEIAPELQRAVHMQEAAIAKADPSTIDANDYELFADPVSTRAIDIMTFDTRRRIVGYIIDKLEVSENGNTIEHDSIILQSPNMSHAVDPNIAYGRRYVYTIRTIAEVEFVALSNDADELVAITVLISSKPTQRQVVDTVEHIAPPPPADFRVDWDRVNRAARLTWAFPINRQRDIKKFQVFRRGSLNEPFELIKEYDFDDSIIRYPTGETPEPTLVEHLTYPKSYFIDFDFIRGSKYIYALCSIDAHGMTSNYSMQFMASYDMSRNDMHVELISSSGAPKPYPNMYVRQEDVFVDVIRDSGHTKMQCYFDPEYADVLDSQNRSLQFLSTDKTNGLYRLQLMNVDLQQGDNLDIILVDRRPALKPRNTSTTTPTKMAGNP